MHSAAHALLCHANHQHKGNPQGVLQDGGKMAAGNVGGLAPMGLGVMAIQLGQKERALIYSSPTADCLQRRRRIFPPLISASTRCKDSNLGTHHICNAAGCWRNSTRGKENLHASAASCSGCWQPRASTHVCVCVRDTLVLSAWERIWGGCRCSKCPSLLCSCLPAMTWGDKAQVLLFKQYYSRVLHTSRGGIREKRKSG